MATVAKQETKRTASTNIIIQSLKVALRTNFRFVPSSATLSCRSRALDHPRKRLVVSFEGYFLSKAAARRGDTAVKQVALANTYLNTQ